jgi:hypothetical protein
MSEKHTPGKLNVHQTSVYFSNNAGGFDIRCCPSPEANARRLRACWNALDGISTTEIEAASRSGSIAYALEKLISQRDELLEVLRSIINDGMHCDVVPHLHTRARAAIAKVEGGAG